MHTTATKPAAATPQGKMGTQREGHSSPGKAHQGCSPGEGKEAGPAQCKPAVNRAMSAPAATGPEFAPSSPELRRVGTHEAVTVGTPPFPSAEVTPGFSHARRKM